VINVNLIGSFNMIRGIAATRLAIAAPQPQIMLKLPIRLTLITRVKRPRSCGASLPRVRSAAAMPAQFTST